MSENANTKHQSKSSVVILIAVIVVIIGVIGFGLYQNSDKSRNSTPDEISTTQIVTTEEPTTQEITTVAPTTAEHTTEEPATEKPTKKPTEPPTENISQEIYNAYKNIIISNSTQMYSIYDINNDGIKELIIELGETTLNTKFDIYSYDTSKGAYYTGTINGSCVLYESYKRTLKSFWAKQGSYCFSEVTLNNGRIEETTLINDYTTGEYPSIDGTELTKAYPNDLNLLASEILY